MAKVIDKLWNWGHLEGSHNKVCNMECNMSPEQFAEEYGIRNSFIDFEINGCRSVVRRKL